jgi:uncharacterized membrane protein YeiH
MTGTMRSAVHLPQSVIIYATASALGGTVYCALHALEFTIVLNTVISMSCVVLLRLWAVKAQWALPSFVLEK